MKIVCSRKICNNRVLNNMKELGPGTDPEILISGVILFTWFTLTT
jgi:hypothetical protein